MNLLLIFIGISFQRQLESQIETATTYSRAAVCLFQKLYSPEEYVGKSLTGAPDKLGNP